MRRPSATYSADRLLLALGFFAFTILASWMPAPSVNAAISWDGEGNSNWWFDPANWSGELTAPGCPCLPPTVAANDVIFLPTDAQINPGSMVNWDLTGEGVVYDPDNDPFFAAAGSLNYPTGSDAATYVGRDYGPEHIYRLYVSRNTTDHNLLTIKSGDLVIAETTIIGRSGSDLANQNLGQVTQLGGTVRLPLVELDIGHSETEAGISRWGNGTWDYRGGTLEVSIEAGDGIRLSHGSDSTDKGPGGHGRFVIHNPTTGGHIRTWDYISASYRGKGSDGITDPFDPDGITTGVATTEFHFANGGTRPVQVARYLTINNGEDNTMIPGPTGGMMSSRLELILDEAPSVDLSGVPIDLGLFDVDFDIGFGSNGGTVRGFGDIDDDGVNDAIFANADGSSYYQEGNTVSALFGSTRYDWTISYSGNIEWSDEDNSVVSLIEPAGFGADVVLLGLGSETVVSGDFTGEMGVPDGMWDCLDVNALTAAIASGSTDLTFDMNGDGTVDLDDITDMGTGWLAVAGAATPGTTSGNPYLLGDANLDGLVNGQDFVAWNGNKFTSLDEWCGGDFNADGMVDGQDFVAWNGNKFTSSDGLAAAVPEPEAVALLIIACLVCSCVRRCAE